MIIELKPEMEALIQRQLASGAFASPEEVIQRALEFLSVEDWLIENRDDLSAKIQEGWDEATRGELIEADQVRANMQRGKQDWTKQHRPA
jgi:antitoxin ParD1/3/4